MTLSPKIVQNMSGVEPKTIIQLKKSIIFTYYTLIVEIGRDSKGLTLQNVWEFANINIIISH